MGKDEGGSRVIGGDCTWDRVGSGVECKRDTLLGAVHCEGACGKLLERVGSAALQEGAHFWGLTSLIGAGWVGVVQAGNLQGFLET